MKPPVRYAVVGLGHIAQVAVLPAFAHARKNSRLVALVSGDRTKRRVLARRYNLEHAYGYEEYDDVPRGGGRRVHRAAQLACTPSTPSARPGGRPRPVREADGGHRARNASR